MSLFTSRRQPNRLRKATLDAPPAVPHAYDDEFNGSSLDPKWTFVAGTIDPVNPVHPYALVVGKSRVSFSTYRESWMMVQPVPNVPLGVYQPVTLDTQCSMWARMSFNTRYNAVANNDADLAIHLLADSAGAPDNNNLLYHNLNESDTNQNFARNGRTVAGVSAIASTTRNVGPQSAGTDALMQDACYLLVQKNGTTYSFGLGWAHGHWLWMAQQTVAFTVGWIGLVFNNVNNNAPGGMVMGVDFFRYQTGLVTP